MDWKLIYRELKTLNWLTLLILSSASYLFMNPSLTLGVILGGLIAIANFSLFQHTIRRAFSSEGHLQANKMSIIAKYYFRFLALGIIIYLLISSHLMNPIGLVIGFSTVVVSIVGLGIKRAWKLYASEAT